MESLFFCVALHLLEFIYLQVFEYLLNESGIFGFLMLLTFVNLSVGNRTGKRNLLVLPE